MSVISDAIADVQATRAARVAAGAQLTIAVSAAQAAKTTFDAATAAFLTSKGALLLILDPTGP